MTEETQVMNVLMNTKFLDDFDKLAKDTGYKDRSEAVREAMRDWMRKKKQEAKTE